MSMIAVNNPILKVCLPLVTIMVVTLVSKYKLKLSLKRDLNFVFPNVRSLLLWLILSIIWMLGTDYFMNWRGAWDFLVWQQQPIYVSLLRILAVVILGPIAEEFVFRGLIFLKLNNVKCLQNWLVIFLISAAWAAIHIAYSIPVILVIFVFGLLLGFAKLKTNSLITPILMHIIWNLYAVW